MELGLGDQSLARMVAEIPEIVLGFFYYIDKEEASALGDEPYQGLEPMLVSEIGAIIAPEGVDITSFPHLNPLQNQLL
jgi:hypothetical protein